MARALGWNAAYSVFETVISFTAMLVLVRIIPPSDYGRAGAVLGVLTLVNGLSFGVFAAHALQAADSREPDWSSHWSAGLYIQAVLMLVCHAIAALCWLSTVYRPIAPLLHLAAVGLLLDWPAQLNSVMLRRTMDFRRLRVIAACGLTLKLGVTVGVSLLGQGAYGLVLGSNVVIALPAALDLLVIRRWRPSGDWWRWPDVAGYGGALRFGFQQGAAGLLFGARSAVEGLVVAATFGYAAIGLLGRAQALFGMSIGRASQLIGESVYPLMPRSASDPPRYARLATFFAQSLCWTAIPGGAYLAWHGPDISRLLYGHRWLDADPLILPAAFVGLAQMVVVIASYIVLATNRLRLCLTVDAMAAVFPLAMILVPLVGGTLLTYAWALAAAHVLAAIVAAVLASPYLTAGWPRIVLLPPAASTLVALAALAALEEMIAVDWLAGKLVLSAGVYLGILGLALRAFFPHQLALVVHRLSRGDRVSRWLRLRSVASRRLPEQL